MWVANGEIYRRNSEIRSEKSHEMSLRCLFEVVCVLSYAKAIKESSFISASAANKSQKKPYSRNDNTMPQCPERTDKS